ncbi:protein kinase domain-containing protein [Calothrix sp. PCC 6303]|uniref:protein kinase domain-containing protein n=1 Tax=Calothrix sp. PCC 6303 TaxID=1170562 RepID=UPI0002A02BB1|nr:protein kinase [Calothrix sp. PCC 6303]AFZ00214.1 serine/threonine protein kinase [Calothrix sp. PCC 6303]
MQPPIFVGTILQNRYQIIKILGQGGFARTYLAEDQRRFNEPCAIKELIPNATGAFSWEKAQELFQQEAEILYQMQHRQIPQFRERFQEDQRLFLVQEYIGGKTYRELLDQGSSFTEKEVVSLLKNLLPVLEHIHSRGIIHRDISPENLIQRESDRLPVLIDFGVVKELATKLQLGSEIIPTPVGKLGYSPAEQMQTGRAYPSSDLYALAVTAIVLLTKKQPQEMYDETRATWKWEQFIQVDPQFARILNKMLNSVPSDRYQSANEVNQALLSLTPVNSPEVSNLQTLAVAPAAVAPTPPTPKKSPVAIPEPNTRSILDSPIAVAAISTAVVVLAGVGSWALVSSIRNQSRERETVLPPQTFPSPVISQTATPTLEVSPSPTVSEPIIYSKKLAFNSSNIATVDSKIKTNETVQYTFFGQEGQQISASFIQAGEVVLTILAPNREPIDITAREIPAYQGILPVTGKYIIQVTPVAGILESQYNLTVKLQSLPVITPTSTPTQTPKEGKTPNPIPTQIPLPPLNEPTVIPTPGDSKTPFIELTPTPTPDATKL